MVSRPLNTELNRFFCIQPITDVSDKGAGSAGVGTAFIIVMISAPPIVLVYCKYSEATK